ncbi:MAG: hypothetical protein QMC73_01015 [Myxococcota bacterium]
MMTLPAALEAPILLVHLAATYYMVGLIWFVQHVHYPLFGAVGSDEFSAYSQSHVARTGSIVGPAMIVEGATAALLLAATPSALPGWLVWFGAGLLLVIWLSTGLLQVPRHRDLIAGFDATAHRRLVTTYWILYLAWSLRGGLALYMVGLAME